MKTKVLCAAAMFLMTGTLSTAQSPSLPTPSGSGFAAGSQASPAPKPIAPAMPLPTMSSMQLMDLPSPTLVGVPCKTTCHEKNCVPELKPKTRVVYSTVCRDYCLPSRSLVDLVLAKCGISDDCDEATGETRTKTLLVKKVVPKCDAPVCMPGDAAMLRTPGVPARISVYPTRP